MRPSIWTHRSSCGTSCLTTSAKIWQKQQCTLVGKQNDNGKKRGKNQDARAFRTASKSPSVRLQWLRPADTWRHRASNRRRASTREGGIRYNSGHLLSVRLPAGSFQSCTTTREFHITGGSGHRVLFSRYLTRSACLFVSSFVFFSNNF